MKISCPYYKRIASSLVIGVAILIATIGSGSWMTAAASTCPAFTPGNLVLSRSLYQGTTSTVTVGQYLPGSTASFTGSETTTSGNVNVTTAFAVGNVVQITTGGVNYSRTLTAVTSTKLTWGVALPSAPVNGDLIGIVAVADGGIPEVWQNETPDASFGVTSPILLDQLSPSATVVNTCAVDPTVMVSSFSSKSELSLNLSPDGTTMTFMGYASPINTLDVSNSNTPGHVDPTDAVQSSYQRIVAQFDPLANFLATPVNAYSGNNGRAAIEANGLYYLAGNAGNGSGTEPLGIINNTGIQATTPGGSADTTVIGVQNGTCTPTPASNGCQYGFATSNVIVNGTALAADKSGKDDNFRSVAIFGNTLYTTKGSGSNGIDTVYQVGTAGTLPTLGTASTTPISVLPGFPTAIAKTAGKTNTYPFAIWFADPNTLYVADEGSGKAPSDPVSNPLAGLQKWVYNGSQWNMVYVLQNGLNLGTPYPVSGYTLALEPSPAGLRNLTGRRNDDGTVTIWALTSTTSANTDAGADPNQLVTITDIESNTNPTVAAGESFSVLRTAQSGEVLRGISFTPGTINPVWSVSTTPAPNASGWQNTSVSVGLTATMADGTALTIPYTLTGNQSAPQTTGSDPANVSVTAEGQTTISYFAQNSAGSVSPTRTLTLNIDETAPIVTPTVPSANAFGWYNSPVNISFACSDPAPADGGVPSGVQSCSGSVTLNEGQNQSATGSATDFAGNQATALVTGINVDLTPPTVTFTGNAGTYLTTSTVAITCTASDALSGIATSTCPSASGPASSFPLGLNTLTAVVTDKAGNQTTVSTTFTVVTPIVGDFTGSFDHNTASANPGGQASYVLTLIPLGGFTGDVTLATSGLPAGVTASFSPATVTGGSGISALTVTTSASTPPGSYQISLSGTSGYVVHSTSVTLIVNSGGDFSGTFDHNSASATIGGQASYVLTLTTSGGFASDVTLSASGLPQGVTAGFSPTVVTGGSGVSTITMSTSSSTPAGIYSVAITGTSGSVVHTTMVNLLVGTVDFTGNVAPNSQSIAIGGSAQYTISLSTVGTLPFGGSVAFSVSGLPQGVTASFSPATADPDSNGSSVMTLTSSGTTPEGIYTPVITATGGGATHARSVTLVVSTGSAYGDFSGTFDHTTASASPGGQANYLLTLTPSGGFSGDVALTAAGLPQGTTLSFTPAIVPGGSGASTITVTTSATTPAGSYSITIMGSSGTLVHSTTITLLVGTVDFTGNISPTQQSASASAGGSAQYTITLSTVGTLPFGNSVTLSVSGLPTGVTANFSPASVNPDTNGSSILTLTVSGTTPQGTYTPLISATGGGVTHARNVTLTVTP